MDLSLPVPHLSVCDCMLSFVKKKLKSWYHIPLASQDGQIPSGCELVLFPPHSITPPITLFTMLE